MHASVIHDVLCTLAAFETKTIAATERSRQTTPAETYIRGQRQTHPFSRGGLMRFVDTDRGAAENS